MKSRNLNKVLTISVLLLLGGLSADGRYTPTNAKNALYFSKASYCDEEGIKNWSCESCAQELSLKNVSVYTNIWSGGQGYSGVSDKRIVVAFRGSQNTMNWMNNLDVKQEQYRPNVCHGCLAHRGFRSSYNHIKGQLLHDVRKLVQGYPNHSILVTGHSLGGAVATFAAAELALMDYSGGVKPKIELYTFGSPRVGNQAFANWFAHLFCAGGHKAYRVVHNADIVPHTTTLGMGFVHVGKEMWYGDYNATTHVNCKYVTGSECANRNVIEDSDCSNSLWFPISVEDHFLYLGTCTSCSCTEEASDAPAESELSDTVVLRAETDHDLALTE